VIKNEGTGREEVSVRESQRGMMGGSKWVEYRGIEGGRERERER
jgi:hypothetical protein